MFAATDHPFHIQAIALFAALLPVVALFALMLAASLVRHYPRTSKRYLDHRTPNLREYARKGRTI